LCEFAETVIQINTNNLSNSLVYQFGASLFCSRGVEGMFSLSLTFIVCLIYITCAITSHSQCCDDYFVKATDYNN